MPALQITTISLSLSLSPVSRSHISNLHVIDSQARHPAASLNLTPGQTLITTLLLLFRQEIVKVIRTLCGLWSEWGGALSRYCQYNAKHQILTLHDL